ncbi:MAG: hypothetical protein RLZ04_2357, partial [Actinomycetota bacterium]
MESGGEGGLGCAEHHPTIPGGNIVKTKAAILWERNK